MRPPRVVDVPRRDARHASSSRRCRTRRTASTCGCASWGSTTRRSSVRPADHGLPGRAPQHGRRDGHLPDVDKSFAIVANGRINVVEYLQGEYANWPADAGDPYAGPRRSERVPGGPAPAVPLDLHVPRAQDVRRELDRRHHAAGQHGHARRHGHSQRRHSRQVGGQPFYVGARAARRTRNEGHEIHGVFPFGLLVYGYGSRTSYMYPGGLDLHIVAVPPPPPVK